MRAKCESEGLAKLLLQKHGLKIKDSVKDALKRHFKVELKAKELYIMPSFNDFLGGRPINESYSLKKAGAETLIGPVLRSEVVAVNEAELYLLDGTYLGTLNQLRCL